MAENSQEALSELVMSLRVKDARSVADEIAKVVARGVTEEKEVNGRANELSQRPLTSDEAYRVSVEMLVASLEPTIMRRHAIREIQEVMNKKTLILWAQDFVEKSPMALDGYEEVLIPDALDVDEFERDMKALVNLLDTQ